MAERKLRAVQADEKPPAKAKSVTQAAADGNRLELLVATRARVAKAVEDASTPARDLASLTRRLLDIAKEIESLTKTEDDEVADASSVPDETFDPKAL